MSDAGSQEPPRRPGEPPAPVLYAIYAALFIVLVATLVIVGVYI